MSARRESATGAARTEIVLTGGESLLVGGDAREVEARILAAARGSIMEFAWLTETATGEAVGINPEHVLMLRPAAPGPPPAL